jgi:Mrp family chromosome partitioning ATPase
MVVAKSVNMARMLKINVIGLIENMAYIKCPDCGREIRLFDESALKKSLSEHKLTLLGSLPMLPGVAAMSQTGHAELDEQSIKVIASVGKKIEEIIKKN